jgi:hypothetical protein
MANTEKIQEKRTARVGKTERTRWRTDESCFGRGGGFGFAFVPRYVE